MQETMKVAQATDAAMPDMGLPPRARIGERWDQVDTPSLMLDLDAFEDNLRTMQALAERHGVALRPHAKAHRCPEVSLRQVALGAQGICCQKVSEAFPFLQAGLRDIHISNEVIGEDKLALLAILARSAQVSVCVDHPEAARALSAALQRHNASLRVLVEIDVGQKRCGVTTPQAAVGLASLVQSLPGLTFAGLQAYHGGAQHKRGMAQRRGACEKAWKLTRQYIDALAAAGISCPVVSGGGTGSAAFDIASGVFTEVQAGSYAFMDADYGSLDWGDDLAFRHSLFMLATVMSRAVPERAILDMGLKSTTAESGMPIPHGIEGVHCVAVNDEHSILAVEPGARIELGDKLRLVPGHCDPTFNLHDELVVVQAGRVHAIWPISARGLSR